MKTTHQLQDVLHAQTLKLTNKTGQKTFKTTKEGGCQHVATDAGNVAKLS